MNKNRNRNRNHNTGALSEALRSSAQRIVDAKFGEGLTLTDSMPHGRKEQGKWRVKVDASHRLGELDAPCFAVLTKDRNGQVIVKVRVALSTRRDRERSKAQAAKLRESGAPADRVQCTDGRARDLVLRDIDDVMDVIDRFDQLIKVRKTLANKGVSTLWSDQGRKLVANGHVVSAQNHKLVVRKGSQRRVVRRPGHAVAIILGETKADRIRKEADAAAEAAEACAAVKV